MELIDTITLLASITGILGFLYVVFIGDRTIFEQLGRLRSGEYTFPKERLRQTILFILASAVLIVLFFVFIFPRNRVVKWKPVAPLSDSGPSDQLVPESLDLRLVRRAGHKKFVPTRLLSTDSFPTAITTRPVENSPIYVGTYGEGLFAYHRDSGSWEALGLEDTTITEVILPEDDSGSIIVATNLGVFVFNPQEDIWVQNGPINGLVTTLAVSPVDPQILIAGTTQGLFRSEDGGYTWLGPELPNETVTDLEFSPSEAHKIFASCLNGAIYLSDNKGLSWHTITTDEIYGSRPIAIDPYSSQTFYSGPSDQGLYRSEDGGQSWEYLGLKGVSISKILLSARSDPLVLVGSDDEKGLFVSWDYGKSWGNYGTLRDIILDIAEDPGEPGTLLISTPHKGLLLTRDYGRTWEETGLQPPRMEMDSSIGSLVTPPNDPEHLFALTGFSPGIQESQDGGVTWSPVKGAADLMQTDIIRIAAHPTDDQQLVASGMGGAVFFSENGGESWEQINHNLPFGGFAPIAISAGDTMFAGPSTQGVWVKAADSTLWEKTGLGVASIVDILVSPDGETVYALDRHGTLFGSLDGGDTWFSPEQAFMLFAVGSFEHGNLVGISADLGIWTTDNWGYDWEQVYGFESFYPSDINLIASLEQPGSYFISNGDNSLSSDDFGVNWREGALPITGMVFGAPGSNLYLSGTGGLFHSNNFGKTWKPVLSSKVITHFTDLEYFDEATVLVGTQGEGLLISEDAGKTWQQSSIGEGYNVKAIWANQTIQPKKVFILLENDQGVTLATSTDAKVWNPQATPCKIISAYESYFERLVIQNGEVWQFVCQDPKEIVFITLTDGASIVTAEIPEGLGTDFTRDIIKTQDGMILLLATSQEIWATFDGGVSWKVVDFVPHGIADFSNDLRSDAVLIGITESTVLGEYYPVIVSPVITHISLVFYILLVGLIIFNAQARESVLAEIQRGFNWFVFSSSDIPAPGGKRYIWLVSLAFLLTCLLVIQVIPAESRFSSELNTFYLALITPKSIQYLIYSILQPYIALQGTQFSAWLLVILGTYVGATLLVTIASLVVRRSRLSHLGEVWRNSLMVLMLGLLLFLITAIFLSQIIGLDKVLMVFIPLIGYKFISVAINTLAEQNGLNRSRVAVLYLLLSSASLILAFWLAPNLSHRFTLEPLLLQDRFFAGVGILNFLIVVNFLFWNRSSNKGAS